MVERYHLVLAAWAVGAGLLLAATTRFAPSFVQRRLVALAGLTGAVLGAWTVSYTHLDVYKRQHEWGLYVEYTSRRWAIRRTNTACFVSSMRYTIR